ncbi:MAG: hypothetical protein WDZ41_01960 [Candidatus Babeliales bacterium]
MELAKTNKDLTNLETSKSKVIKAFNEVKIFNTENDELLKSTLKYIFVMVGLQNIPSREEFHVLVTYIKDNYSSYSVSEIKIAFELALKGEFEAETNHFGYFSCKYLSEILRAYIEYRMRIAKEYMIEQQRQKDLEEQNKTPNPEKVRKLKSEFFDQTLAPFFDNYKKEKKLYFGLVPVRIIYESLKEFNYIDLSVDEQNNIKKEAGNEVNDKHRICEMTRQKKTKKEVWFELCQEKAIRLSFDKLISQEIPFEFAK